MKNDSETHASRRTPPIARTPEAQENEMIALAMEAARKKIEDGSASSQIIVHFLQLGTEKARLEREKLRAESTLAMAKAEAMKSLQTSDQITEEALSAFKRYQGTNFVPAEEASMYILCDD